MKKIRVLYVEAAYGFGGSLTGLLNLFQHLPNHIEAILLTPFDAWAQAERPPALEYKRVNVPIVEPVEGGHWLPGVVRYYQKQHQPWKIVTRQAIEEFKPDVVHTNNSLTINFSSGIAANKRGIPCISHQKDFEYEGKFTRWMARNSPFDLHLGTSRENSKQLIKLGVPAEKCHSIYEPVVGPNQEQLERRRSRILSPIPVVAMHSMVIRWKGQHVFLRAVAEVLRRGNHPIQPVIAGSPPAGEQRYLDELKTLAVELGIADRVQFVGHQRDVYGYLAGVDIAVHASITPEPFGRVVPEAMLMEIGGIVSSGGGPAEYIRHGETGLESPRGDVQALADAIETLVASPDKRLQMGIAARQYAINAFDPDRLSKEISNYYEEILDR